MGLLLFKGSRLFPRVSVCSVFNLSLVSRHFRCYVFLVLVPRAQPLQSCPALEAAALQHAGLHSPCAPCPCL